MTKNNGAFQEVAKSLTGIRKIMRVMTMAILGGGTIVLSLILVLWLRERIYEIGILLSIGVSKVAIVGQFYSGTNICINTGYDSFLYNRKGRSIFHCRRICRK